MTRLLIATTALVLTPASAATAPTPPGRRAVLDVEGATLFVPEGYRPGPDGSVDVVLHLHGGPAVVEPALVEAGFPAVLVAFNRKGLSSVYSRPFADPTLFPRLLDEAMRAVRGFGLAGAPKPGRVVVSSFSAGFGGVRELLKVPAHVDRIDGLVMADSLYAGYTGDPARAQVDPALMDGFRRFAAAAAAGRKSFLLTHSAQVPGGYAGTTETADFLIRALDGAAAPVRVDWGGGWTQTRNFTRGRFVVLGFDGTGPADHLAHLRRLGALWARFRSISGPGR